MLTSKRINYLYSLSGKKREEPGGEPPWWANFRLIIRLGDERWVS